MRILLIGNHTCGNRGDGAILRGIIDTLDQFFPDADLTITSRYPISSSFLLGRKVLMDPLFGWRQVYGNKLIGRFKSFAMGRIVPILLGLTFKYKIPFLAIMLPSSVRAVIREWKAFDIAIQVGGSFFVDLYGLRQFELPFCALLAGCPLLLLGHSLGPFDLAVFKKLCGWMIEGSTVIALREPVSRSLVENAGLPVGPLWAGSDTAWLVRPSPAKNGSSRVLQLTGGRKAIAITVRELAPFDKRLGVAQIDYELAFARLINHFHEIDYDVIATSTCTGIDSYHRDDRMNALHLYDIVDQPSRFHIVMDELNDLELGELYRDCEFTVGTRLHSVIISLNFGTPAIALNYEHKSEGVLSQLGLPELSAPISDLLNGQLQFRLDGLLSDLPTLRERCKHAVQNERVKALSMVQSALKVGLLHGRK